MTYRPSEIEARWRDYWREHETYRVENDSHKPKFYILNMFPYPSGAGLHVGHPLGYIATDIYARHKRMNGYNVLNPMGYDSFGLPAEQYAIETGQHPADTTEQNVQRFREQLDLLGFSFDWSREVRTSDPQYYRWTQWIFLQIFEHYYDLILQKARPVSDLVAQFGQHGSAGVRAACNEDTPQFTADDWQAMDAKAQADILMDYRLAYRRVSYVNWCEALGTVLANDEVKDGVSERGGHPVVKKPMEQWAIRTTAYAERLLDDLETVEWSDALKTQQRNWIGRSEGARVHFRLEQAPETTIEIFTTRPDTIFGATFMVLAPEHDLVAEITTPEQQAAINEYLQYVGGRSERERMTEVKTVTGAFTGAHVLHPFTEVRIPIWISEYVLKDYGTGAIMAVPSDDERDYKFAEHFELPIIPVVDKSAYPDADTHDKVGTLINSYFLNGLEVADAIKRVIAELEQRGVGEQQINYRLRDANFSRQRYWGEPFPIVYDEQGIAQPIDADHLPVTLPPLDNFKPTAEGESPLARATEWRDTPQGQRETDTMPGNAGSSWYFLRYMDPDNDEQFASNAALNYWESVDLYVGGTEHAVGHLLYARMWHKFLYDLEYVPTAEPFRKLINQGMIQGVIEYLMMRKEKEDGRTVFTSADMVGEAEQDDFTKLPVLIDFVSDYGTDGSYLSDEGVAQFKEWRPSYHNAIFLTNDAGQMTTVSEVGKMSKSKFNVINPDDVVAEYGADCFRMYEMFLGPIEQHKPFDMSGISGVANFLRRFYGLFYNEDGDFVADNSEPTKGQLKILHTCIKKVNEDIERFSFNTCVSAFMVTVNELRKSPTSSQTVLEPLAILIAPFAPHLAEELWHEFESNEGSVFDADYPQHDESLLVEDEVLYPIQIGKKVRAKLPFAKDMSREAISEAVLASAEVQKWIGDKTVRKVIVVPGRMVNVVVG